MMEVKDEFGALVMELITAPEEGRESEIIQMLDVFSPALEYTDYIYLSDEFRSEDGNLDIDVYTKKVI